MPVLNDDKKKKLNDFVLFVRKQLEIKVMPTIIIQNGRKGLKTTANYDYTKDDKVVKVNGKNRALVDIMRSVAHELVHHKQYEEELLTNSIKDGSDGSEIENQAHSTAGLLIRKYGKIDEDIYEC